MSLTVRTGQSARRTGTRRCDAACTTAFARRDRILRAVPSEPGSVPMAPVRECRTVVRPDRPATSGRRSGAASPAPLHRMIVAVDIVSSTARTNPGRASLRLAMYAALEEALMRSGIAERHRDQTVDRGDGVLVMIHPVDQVPKTLLISRFIPALGDLIDRHNAHHPGVFPFRLRAALHAGEVHYDRRGPFGEALDVACRLVDSPEFKDATRRTSVSLMLVVSDYLFQSVVKHGYDGIDDREYLPIVRIELGGSEYRGWVRWPIP